MAVVRTPALARRMSALTRCPPAGCSNHSGSPPLLAGLRDDLARWSSADRRTVSLADTDAAYAALPPYARARFRLTNGVLWKAGARCVYRRDEVTAWAIIQLLERQPDLPDFDVVLNCRDGPLLKRPGCCRHGRADPVSHAKVPLVLSYSTDGAHSEVAFPDYTLWGLPGKLKPWAQLRLDLLHRAQVPYSRRLPKLLATGVINSYHSTLGVRTREAVQKCAEGRRADRRLDIRYHSLYFERWYSTEEHCRHRYILLSPGSHAVWLDHMKQKLLCGSLVLLLEPPVPQSAFQYDAVSRMLQPGVHYLSVPLPPLDKPERRRGGDGRPAADPQATVCEALKTALDWAEANPAAAEAIASRGRALMRDHVTMERIYEYMGEALRGAASLIGYHPAEATRPRTIAGYPFNASNMSIVPTDADAFARWIRNDTTYPPTAQIREADWEAAVMRYNYSRMGLDFRASAQALQAEVATMREEKKAAERAEREAAAAAAGRGRGGGGRRRGRGRGRGGRGRAAW